MKSYLVEARLKFPSCYHTGYDLTIYATTKAEAIKKARKEVFLEGHTRKDGALSFKAFENMDD